MKTIEGLTAEDLRTFPVWQYVNDDELGETAVRPVETILKNARLTEHFLTISLLDRGRWFEMARYHDVDAAERGPKSVAAFLGLPVDAVFPIAYNISRYCIGDPDALAGTILKEPRERLTRAQVIALAVP